MASPSRTSSFAAIVLAGERSASDPVARAAAASCKAFAPVGDRPMVLRVIDALRASYHVDDILLCGPPPSALKADPDIAAQLDSTDARLVGLASTPTRSVLEALRHVPPDKPVLVTTADHALLSHEMVDHFCREAQASGRDALFGLARYQDIEAAYPHVRRTVSRFSDDGYCGCNLFGLMTPSARSAAEFWVRVEDNRKKPMRVIAALGWMGVVRYAIGRLSLADALARLSKHLGIRVDAVIMPFAEAAIDVDTPADLELVQAIVNDRSNSRS